MYPQSEQELFEVYLALMTNSAYAKAIFSIDSFGKDKTASSLAWEASIAEEQGFVPIFAMFSKKLPYFISFSSETMLTGYYNQSPLEH